MQAASALSIKIGESFISLLLSVSVIGINFLCDYAHCEFLFVLGFCLLFDYWYNLNLCMYFV